MQASGPGSSISGIYDVRAFGARGDGINLDTPAINKAIDAASAAGGGTIFFPAGNYLSVSIHLKSNIALYLSQGATIVAAETSTTARYDAPEPNPFDHYQDFGHTHFHNSLIWGESLENVSILGPGRIWGKGLSRGQSTRPTSFPATAGDYTTEPDGTTRPFGRRARRGRRNSSRPTTAEDLAGGARPSTEDSPTTNRSAFSEDQNFYRGRGQSRPTTDLGPNQPYPNARDQLAAGIGNKSISLKNCHNVILKDFSILHGGHFGILVTGVDNLTIDNLKIDTNRDGMDIDSCRNVRVSNCSVNSPWDDAIVLKSDYALGYLRPQENTTITNCFVTGGYYEGTLMDGTWKRSGREYRAARTGRIKLGTESNGGFKNITVSNCVFDCCGGFALESVDGGPIEDITISNISMRDIVNMPIFIRLGNRARGPNSPPAATIRHINIGDIVCSNTAGRYASVITGIPMRDIEDVKIHDIRIIQQGGGNDFDATSRPTERETAYPEPSMFGTSPSYGFYIRHVNGIEMSNIEVTYMKEDRRPPFVLQNVTNADFHNIKASHPTDVPMFRLHAVDDFNARQNLGMQDGHMDHVDDGQF
ncbi:MAG: right-handed parallel beta-helix repeat-containing protein [Planctomycetota bacterium]|nr:right-handed parallel beta-helix repeat-containing protein [Planctomycetota bacterium]